MRDYLDQLTLIISSLAAYATFKLVCVTVLVTVYNFFFGAGSGIVMSALLGLVIFDFFTGVGAAYWSGDRIESRKIFKTALKIVVYALLVSAAHLVENILPGAPFLIHNSIVSFLAVTELISILENAGRMGFAVPKILLNQLQTFKNKK